MNSDNRTDIYSEFESEANEIMFGKATLPDRPLTDRESSKRKKIILKLLDQKLKFQLIELKTRQQKQMLTGPMSTVNHDGNIDSNMDMSTAASSAMPTNFEYTQNLNQFYPSSEYLQQNWQPPYENVWQPPIYAHYEMNGSWYPHANNFQPNFQSFHFNQDRNIKPSFNHNRIRPSNNLVCPTIASSVNRQQKGITTVSKPKNITTNTLLNNKIVTSVTPKSSASVASVNQLTSISLQKSHPDSTNQFDHQTTYKETRANLPCKKSLSTETESFEKYKINSESINNDRHNGIDSNLASSQEVIESKNLLQPPLAPLVKSNDSSHGRRRYNLEDSKIKCLLIQQPTDVIEPNDIISDKGRPMSNAVDLSVASSSLQDGIQSQNLLQPASAPLLISNGRLRKRERKKERRKERRRERRICPSEDSQNNRMQQPTEAIKSNDIIADEVELKLNTVDLNAVSSNLQDGIQSKNLLEAPSAPLLRSNGRLRRRKRRRCHSSEDSQNKRMLIQQPTEATEPNLVITDEGGSMVNASSISVPEGDIMTITNVVNIPSNNSSINVPVDKTHSASNTQCSRNHSVEWKMLNELVTAMCRNELSHFEPISPSQFKQNKQILIQMSINPNAIRSNSTVVQIVSAEKLEKFINECKVILFNVSEAGTELQSNFTESRNELIADMKALISKQATSEKTVKSMSVEKRVKTIIKTFSCSGENNSELVNKLIKNPYALEDEGIKNRIAINNQSVDDVMRQIKGVLDSCITVRQPKKFNLSLSYCYDVPFAVNLFDKSGKMTKEYATALQGTLLDSINCFKIHPKPILRDITFNDGSLTIICINQMSFEWLEKIISDHLSINILPFKNIISKNELKTICMKFEAPQYYHFNYLMERLKVDNPLLLTRRWELRSSQHKIVDSTKCMHVGVDVNSLIILEQMNRVGKLRGSSVYFEISYDVNEENFERTNFVKKTRKSR